MRLIGITKKYGEKTVYEDLNATFDGITAVLGASGSGKTTLLNIVANLTDYEGRVEGAGKIAYMFQQPRLLKNLTVFENLLYTGAKEKDALDMLKKVGVAPDLYPKELSGGMADRVSLARAFLKKADTLLMDEPFRGLDVGLKTRLMDLFGELYKDSRATVIFVTHSPFEARRLASRALIVSGGGFAADLSGGSFTEERLTEILKRE